MKRHSTNRSSGKSSVHEVLRARWHASRIRKPGHGARDAVRRDRDVIPGFCDLRSRSASDRRPGGPGRQRNRRWSPSTAKASRPLVRFSPLRRPSDTAPTELEAKAVVRRFLEHYQAYTPATVDQNLATALNMMTANLRTYSLGKLRDEDTVGKIKEDRIISQLRDPHDRTCQERALDIRRVRREGDSSRAQQGRIDGSNCRPLQRAPGSGPPFRIQSERPACGGVLRATDGRRARRRSSATEPASGEMK